MKHLKSFKESQSLKPSVEEVQDFFHYTIQDFCDDAKADFKFRIICNNWSIPPKPDDDITWVSFQISSDTEFKTDQIYPLVKRLFDWSKENGSDNLEIGLSTPKIVMSRQGDTSKWTTYVNSEIVRNPMNFELVGKVWIYHNIFSWK